MKRFAALVEVLDRSAPVHEKVAALAGYLRTAPPADAAWALHLLAGRRLERPLPAPLLAGWAREAVGVPDWLFEECYRAVEDLAETIALLLDTLPRRLEPELPLAVWMEERLLPLQQLPAEEQRVRLRDWWAALDRGQTLLLTRILTGEPRTGVSRDTLERARALAGYRA